MNEPASLPLSFPRPADAASGLHIVVIGSVNMDLVIRADRFPGPGETLFGRDFQTVPGGKGANMAVAAARLAGPGTRVSFVGCVGDDAFGAQLATGLESNGVDIQHLARVADAPSGTALITLDEAGQNTIVVAPGANGTLSEAQVRSAWRALGKIDVLLMPLETSLESVCMGAELAERDGVKVIFNPAPAPTEPLPGDLLRRAEVLIVNEHEARIITGREKLDGTGDEEWALRRLRQMGSRQVVLTLGARGAVLLDRGFQIHRLAAQKVEAVDTVGAGDCFIGALGVRLAEGAVLPMAARFAIQASGLAVSRSGAQPSLPYRHELG